MDRVVRTLLDITRPGVAERWARLTEAGSSMGAIARLRRQHGPEVARFVSLQLELARRGGGPTFRTSKGSEQATHPAVAGWRAERFARAAEVLGDAIAWDATCGCGADALALARHMPALLATDLDPASTWCAAANLRLEQEGRDTPLGRWGVALMDATKPSFVPHHNWLGLLDPDRRVDGIRSNDPERWSPSLPVALKIAQGLAGAQLKLPAGLDASRLGDASLEWVSVDGEMKELAASTGALAGPRRRAIVLRSRGAGRLAFDDAPAPLPEPIDAGGATGGAWLVEFDVAIWASGLAGALARRVVARPLEGAGQRGYLTATRPPAAEWSPAVRAWRILDSTAGDRRRVREMLRRHAIGPLTVKKRNHPDTSEALARRFAGPGPRPGRLAVTRTGNRTLAMLLEDPAESPKIDNEES